MERDRLGTQLPNACIGFTIGYVIGARLQGCRTGVVAGLVWGVLSGVTSGLVYDNIDDIDIDEIEGADLGVES